jgi:hypothetical protein
MVPKAARMRLGRNLLQRRTEITLKAAENFLFRGKPRIGADWRGDGKGVECMERSERGALAELTRAEF